MKKVRRPPMEASPAPPAYPPPVAAEDARARFRLQSLMQDFEELLKETTAKKRRLQMERQNLARLTDEVRFLRRRYKFLTKNPSPAPFKVKALSQKAPKPPRHRARKSPAAPSTLSQYQEQVSKHERSHGEKEVAAPSTSAILDLNQISLPNGEEEEEEEGFQVSWEPLPIEMPSARRPSEGDAPGGDLKLSICRDLGGGSSRAGKRKISWQDQVVLKV